MLKIWQIKVCKYYSARILCKYCKDNCHLEEYCVDVVNVPAINLNIVKYIAKITAIRHIVEYVVNVPAIK